MEKDMAPTIYQHPNDKELRGHLESCRHTSNHSAPCGCDTDPPYNTLRTMQAMGWKLDERTDDGIAFTSYYRNFGPHIITVAHCVGGWQLRWEKGPGFTCLEEGNFATIGHLMAHIWGGFAQRFDEFIVMSWEYAARTQQLKDAGIEPREFGKKPKPTDKMEMVPGPLKHEVTGIMDQKGKE